MLAVTTIGVRRCAGEARPHAQVCAEKPPNPLPLSHHHEALPSPDTAASRCLSAAQAHLSSHKAHQPTPPTAAHRRSDCCPLSLVHPSTHSPTQPPQHTPLRAPTQNHHPQQTTLPKAQPACVLDLQSLRRSAVLISGTRYKKNPPQYAQNRGRPPSVFEGASTRANIDTTMPSPGEMQPQPQAHKNTSHSRHRSEDSVPQQS